MVSHTKREVTLVWALSVHFIHIQFESKQSPSAACMRISHRLSVFCICSKRPGPYMLYIWVCSGCVIWTNQTNYETEWIASVLCACLVWFNSSLFISQWKSMNCATQRGYVLVHVWVCACVERQGSKMHFDLFVFISSSVYHLLNFLPNEKQKFNCMIMCQQVAP